MKRIIVFGDGETWADYEECTVYELTDKAYDKMNEDGEYPANLMPLRSYRLPKPPAKKGGGA